MVFAPICPHEVGRRVGIFGGDQPGAAEPTSGRRTMIREAVRVRAGDCQHLRPTRRQAVKWSGVAMTKTGEPTELGPVEEPAADFVLDLLAELRASHFRPRGWRRFFGRY
jgi:hypothetical protein